MPKESTYAGHSCLCLWVSGKSSAWVRLRDRQTYPETIFYPIKNGCQPLGVPPLVCWTFHSSSLSECVSKQLTWEPAGELCGEGRHAAGPSRRDGGCWVYGGGGDWSQILVGLIVGPRRGGLDLPRICRESGRSGVCVGGGALNYKKTFSKKPVTFVSVCDTRLWPAQPVSDKPTLVHVFAFVWWFPPRMTLFDSWRFSAENLPSFQMFYVARWIMTWGIGYAFRVEVLMLKLERQHVLTAQTISAVPVIIFLSNRNILYTQGMTSLSIFGKKKRM